MKTFSLSKAQKRALVTLLSREKWAQEERNQIYKGIGMPPILSTVRFYEQLIIKLSSDDLYK